MHQVILNILVTKDPENKVFEYIYQLGETLESIAWSIRASCRHNIQAMQGQDEFGIYMIFNLASVVDWQVITAAKQRQVDIGNFQK